MRGKNKIEISPKISEEVTGGVSIQDAADYTPTEIETVDIVTPKRLQSNWRNEMFDMEGEEDIEEAFGALVKGVKALSQTPVGKSVTGALSGAKRKAGNFFQGNPINSARPVSPEIMKAQRYRDQGGQGVPPSLRTKSAPRIDPTPKTTTPPPAPKNDGPTQAQMDQKAAEQQARTRQQMRDSGDTRGSSSNTASQRGGGSSSNTAALRGRSTTTSRPAPKRTSADEKLRTASKEDRMAAWAKANPKLAAAKAKRDATRGTSATTNPQLQKSKSRMPAPAAESVEFTTEKYSALVRQGIKVGGKKGGRAVQAGEKAAAAKGRDAAAKAKEGNKKKMVGDGKYEKMGAKVGGVGGAAAGFLVPDGPAMVAGEIAGGLAGAKVGGKIGRQIDKFRAKRDAKKDAKKSVKEEASDAMKDRRMERGGVGGNTDYSRPPAAPNLAGKKKPKKGGPSAMDIVRADIEKKYGKGAIMDTKKTKKEHYDWRSEMGIVEEEGKKDACYKKVKASAKVWPSAYASGRLVQCRKKGAANYGNSKKD